jgi:hypothetical protein
VGLVRSTELRDSSQAEMRKMTSVFWGGERGVDGVRPRPPWSVERVHSVRTSDSVWDSRGWLAEWRAEMSFWRSETQKNGCVWSCAVDMC